MLRGFQLFVSLDKPLQYCRNFGSGCVIFRVQCCFGNTAYDSVLLSPADRFCIIYIFINIRKRLTLHTVKHGHKHAARKQSIRCKCALRHTANKPVHAHIFNIVTVPVIIRYIAERIFPFGQISRIFFFNPFCVKSKASGNAFFKIVRL